MNGNPSTRLFVASIRRLLEEGAPIHGIGIEGHLWHEDILANPGVLKERLDKVATLKLPIWISEFDVADDEIVRRVDEGDLVITSDIPLAAEVIQKGAHALSPRGELLTRENIGAKLNMRDFMDTMRSSGVEMGGGPRAYGQRDKQEFANNLDRFLTQHAGKG